jgi:hypothetical protein
MPMVYLSGSISLSLRLCMGTTGLRPGSDGIVPLGSTRPPLHAVQWQGVADHVKRNVAVGTKLG